MSNGDNKNDIFAEITVPFDQKNSRTDGSVLVVPPRSSNNENTSRKPSKYAGRGAFKAGGGKSTKPETVEYFYDSSLAFIGKVQVFTWGAQRSFYERFREDALKLRDVHGEAAEYVPFFSYIPQISQLNTYQRRYYLWFRDCVKKGRFIQADLSYILLLVYEIINLSDEGDHEADVLLLSQIWNGYRADFPVIDKYMAEWVCDFCLLYRLGVPDVCKNFLPDICKRAVLKEFYMSISGGMDTIMNGNVLETFADYDYRVNKKDLPEELFVHYIPALEAAANAMGRNYFISDTPTVLVRDAFCGSLCAHNIKRRIAVEYYKTLRNSGVTHMLGSAVKYTENKLRRFVGIKSRLHTDGLPDVAKFAIDRYFEEVMPSVFTPKKAHSEALPEYEKYYDAPPIPFSHETAREIEVQSRAAAQMLETEDVALEVVPTVTDEQKSDDSLGYVPRLVQAMLEGATLEEWCKTHGILPDTAAAAVNEAATDAYGDILLEQGADGWQIIDDYLEEAAEIAVSES